MKWNVDPMARSGPARSWLCKPCQWLADPVSKKHPRNGQAVCLLAYAADKFAARSGGWRTRESTLLLLGLLGGWPGALLAQQWLRHKSAKPSFRNAFWLTVVVHTVPFVVLSSPAIGAWRLLVH